MKSSLRLSLVYPSGMDVQMRKIVQSLEEHKILRSLGLVLHEYSYPQNSLKEIASDSDLIYIISEYASKNELMFLYHLLKYADDLSIPIIYALHNPLFPYSIYRPKLMILAFKSILRLFLLEAIKRKEGSKLIIHTLNTFEYKLCAKLDFNVFIAPQGVDLNIFKPDKKYDEFTLFFSGLNYRKGADIVLNSIITLDKLNLFKARLIITYGAVTLPNLLRKIKELQHKIKNIDIEIHEFLDREKFAEVLSKSHVLLFPSKLETWGRIVVESLASGTPVIGFDIPGAMQDVVKRFKCGYVIKPFSYELFLKAIVGVYTLYRFKLEEYIKLVKRCREISYAYDIENMSKKFINILKSYVER
jgi:glycosyltransferase involved in cell wall biosynthesis